MLQEQKPIEQFFSNAAIVILGFKCFNFVIFNLNLSLISLKVSQTSKNINV